MESQDDKQFAGRATQIGIDHPILRAAYLRKKSVGSAQTQRLLRDSLLKSFLRAFFQKSEKSPKQTNFPPTPPIYFQIYNKSPHKTVWA